ncbi:carboxypeptidase-like regulatory domain-containing protein [Polaribacter porphyrae]|uniref:Carboxypeptidase-like regulatory domain-containing protein n=1 Tax=Polaribacter porphyrae TaxID=1137780 RepID=A0A2S7WLW0_9FLAO|nr:carboxypeptidase-like regulatory domain-containing protein [Polaribacter porphyrae]PQJ78559.1 hypothetical protein BTO18_04870 [Polaribacter porphyrae]
MKTKLLFTVILFYAFSNLHAQKIKKIISGVVTDSLGVVVNANIINLKTSQGTFSNDSGLFRIFAVAGDTLSVSSVQHIKTKIVVTDAIINNKTISITLKSNTYKLDEFELKRHNLLGSLSSDLKKVKTNKKDSLLRDVMDFSNIDMKANVADDYIDKRVRPQINETDPTRAFVGAGTAAAIPFKYSQRLWALRKKLSQKKAFPYKILSELGEKFFFDELKIPIDKYFHFLDYCNPLGIEDLHKEGKILDVIKIFRTESVSYHKIIKKE